MYDNNNLQKNVMFLENASVQIVDGVSQKGNQYYRLVVTVQGYEMSMFLTKDQVTIFRLMGYIK